MENKQPQVLAAALAVAAQHGYNRVSLQQIADAAGVSKQLPLTYFGTMTALRRKIIREAIRTRHLRILAQGLALRDPHALRAPPDLRAAAAATLAG